jgi:hypothetical protein
MFAMYPAYISEKARELRLERRLSIDEIAERLAIPRTTIFYWVRDLPLGRARANTAHAGTRGMQAKYRRLREDAYEAGRSSFSRLAADPTFRDFVCMYIGEGSKRCRNVVALCNSDPAVIRLADTWIKQLATNPVRYALQYHADHDVEALKRFWADQVGADPHAIALQRKSNSGGLVGRAWRSVHGVLTVRAGDTLLRAKLEAWMDCARESWV